MPEIRLSCTLVKNYQVILDPTLPDNRSGNDARESSEDKREHKSEACVEKKVIRSRSSSFLFSTH